MELCPELEKTHLSMFFLYISVNVSLACLEFALYVAGTHLEGSMSQNIDIGLSFCCIVCRRWNLKKYPNIEKYPT